MSGKRAKQKRKEMQEVAELLAPLLRILPEAALELEDEGEEDLFEKWASIALALHLFKPNIPLAHLLPSKLEHTFEKYGQDLLKHAEQIEDTP